MKTESTRFLLTFHFFYIRIYRVIKAPQIISNHILGPVLACTLYIVPYIKIRGCRFCGDCIQFIGIVNINGGFKDPMDCQSSLTLQSMVKASLRSPAMDIAQRLTWNTQYLYRIFLKNRRAFCRIRLQVYLFVALYFFTFLFG